MKYFDIFLIIILLHNYGASAQQWTVKAPMMTGRVTPAIAVYNNKIYIFGGSNGPLVSTSEVYDPASNSWSTVAPIPTLRDDVPAATVNGKIYVIGGYTPSGAVSTVEAYDPVANTWATKANMPTARSQTSAGVINNKIYVVGGWPGQYATLECYDPSTDTWTTKSPLPSGLIAMNASVVFNNNEMFLVGGRDYSGTNYDSVYKYNATSDIWVNLHHNISVPVFAGSASVVNNKLHYFGGKTANCQTCFSPNIATHYIYDTVTGVWSTGLKMLQKRSYHVSAVVNGNVYVIGGADSTGATTNANEEYSEPAAGVLTFANETNTTVYPNPVSNELSIEGAAAGAVIQIYNIVGQQVYTGVVSSSKEIIDTRAFSKGVYTIQISNRNGYKEVKKLVKD